MISRSPWLYHFNSGGCNGCDIELIASIAPGFDLERLGCVLKGSPRHADILLVTGCVTKQAEKRLKRIYSQLAEKKVVIAIGSCALSGGAFRSSYNRAGPVDRIIPVDIYIPGCPPRPQAIIHGIKTALERL